MLAACSTAMLSSPEPMAEIHKFNQPDQVDGARFFIEFLEAAEKLPMVKEVRDFIADEIDARPGRRLLDVGCGLGTAALHLADRVGMEGHVCGIDISESMVAEASRRANGRGNVEFRTGNVCSLPFPDRTFDGVRMERVLLYVPDRKQALAELLRVTKPGGRIAIADVDPEATAIHSSDPIRARRMMHLVCESIPNPASGRELWNLFVTAGLSDLAIYPMVVSTPFPFLSQAVKDSLYAAASAGKIASAEVDAWFQELRDLNESGRFHAFWFHIIVIGRVPA